MFLGAETFVSEPHTHIYMGKNVFYQSYIHYLRLKYASSLCSKMLFSWIVNRAFGAIFQAKQGYRTALVAIGIENQMVTLSVRQYEQGHICLAEQSTVIIP